LVQWNSSTSAVDGFLMTLPKSTPQKAILPKSPIAKVVLQKTTLTKAISRPRPDLSRIAAVVANTAVVVVHLVGRGARPVGRWVSSALAQAARLTADLMRKRPPRFETTIAVGTFAFVVVAAVAGVLMLGDAHL
jgi:hypothetical protein